MKRLRCISVFGRRSDYNRVLIAFGTETMAEDGYKAVNLVKIDPDVRIIAWIKPNVHYELAHL